MNKGEVKFIDYEHVQKLIKQHYIEVRTGKKKDERCSQVWLVCRDTAGQIYLAEFKKEKDAVKYAKEQAEKLKIKVEIKKKLESLGH